MVNGLNRLSRNHHPELLELDSRIANYELAARMQVEAMERVDLSQESAETRKMYGLDEEITKKYGRRCLLARRLVGRRVQFGQITQGGGDHPAKLTARREQRTS